MVSLIKYLLCINTLYKTEQLDTMRAQQVMPPTPFKAYLIEITLILDLLISAGLLLASVATVPVQR